ncbi:polymorphic toxin type 43 domain-containing protein [Flavisphingomonas formosensis]|uniref:polymorphic toxin type 43 domain-containing protein n=1 Tax=Flavisphingomonas formosensis TaxID=861534 RepID=UPI0012F941A6
MSIIYTVPGLHAAAINANKNRVVGGIFSRREDGTMVTNEGSGHFWQNWTPEIRRQFSEMMRVPRV